MRCDAALLVLAPDEVATWARHPIQLGHPRFTLEPIVVAFSELPRIANADDAARARFAVLSVLAHRDLPSATFALDAMQQLPDDARRLYLDLVLNALPAAQRQILEASMLKNYKFQSDFFLRHERAGRHQGLCDAAAAVIRAKTGELTNDQWEPWRIRTTRLSFTS